MYSSALGLLLLKRHMTQTQIQVHRDGSPSGFFDRRSYAPHRAGTAPMAQSKQHLEREDG